MDEAVESFSNCLELKAQCLGEKDISLAENYYYYGLALLQKWQADNILAKTMPERGDEDE